MKFLFSCGETPFRANHSPKPRKFPSSTKQSSFWIQNRRGFGEENWSGRGGWTGRKKGQKDAQKKVRGEEWWRERVGCQPQIECTKFYTFCPAPLRANKAMALEMWRLPTFLSGESFGMPKLVPDQKALPVQMQIRSGPGKPNQRKVSSWTFRKGHSGTKVQWESCLFS